MTKYIFILYWLVVATSYGTVIAVPSPHVMLKSADTVVVGSLVKDGDNWILKTKEVLKGRWKSGELILLTSPFNEMAFSFQSFFRLVNVQDFLFVGNFDSKTNSVQPIYGLSSAWPPGTVKELLPLRTLPEYVSFAKEVLAVTANPTTDTEKVRSTPTPIRDANLLKPDASEPLEKRPSSPRSPLESKMDLALSTVNKEQMTLVPLVVLTVMIAAVIGLIWLFIKCRK